VWEDERRKSKEQVVLISTEKKRNTHLGSELAVLDEQKLKLLLDRENKGEHARLNKVVMSMHIRQGCAR
jgi:hypothetical protein